MIVHDNTRCLKFRQTPPTNCIKYDEDASYFSVTINGVQIGKVQSEITKPMTNVNVYAGDNYLPAADAKYNNLIWEEISGGMYRGLFKYYTMKTYDQWAVLQG